MRRMVQDHFAGSASSGLRLRQGPGPTPWQNPVMLTDDLFSPKLSSGLVEVRHPVPHLLWATELAQKHLGMK